MGEMKREKIEAKKRTFERIEESKKAILEAINKRRCKDDEECWFDSQKCPYHLKVKKFEDIRRGCGNCYQLPTERFFDITESVFGNSEFFERIEKKAREDGREEGRNEAKEEAEEEKDAEAANIYDEITEEIDNFLGEVEKNGKVFLEEVR